MTTQREQLEDRWEELWLQDQLGLDEGSEGLEFRDEGIHRDLVTTEFSMQSEGLGTTQIAQISYLPVDTSNHSMGGQVTNDRDLWLAPYIEGAKSEQNEHEGTAEKKLNQTLKKQVSNEGFNQAQMKSRLES